MLIYFLSENVNLFLGRNVHFFWMKMIIFWVEMFTYFLNENVYLFFELIFFFFFFVKILNYSLDEYVYFFG